MLMCDNGDFNRLFQYYGQGYYDYVIFRCGDQLVIGSKNLAENSEPILIGERRLEELVQNIHEQGKSVKLVLHINLSGEYALPDLDELEEFEIADY